MYMYYHTETWVATYSLRYELNMHFEFFHYSYHIII